MNILRFVSLTLHKVLSLIGRSHRNYAALNKIRIKNSTCRIDGCHLEHVVFGNYVTILNDASVKDVSIGDHSYISNNSAVSTSIIGKFCSIGPYVTIGLGPHPTRKFVSTHPVFYSHTSNGCTCRFREDSVFDDSIPETIIGNDVWIGANVIIPGNITIGDGAAVAAGSVVVKDVPPYAIMGGNPAKIIRFRFPNDHIKHLLAIKWWDWSNKELIDRLDYFTDIDEFVKKQSIGKQ